MTHMAVTDEVNNKLKSSVWHPSLKIDLCLKQIAATDVFATLLEEVSKLTVFYEVCITLTYPCINQSETKSFFTSLKL